MGMNAKRYKFITMLATLMVMLCYQNCSYQVGKPSYSSSGSKMSMSGNGETYDGKAKFDRNIPGYMCGKQDTPHSSIDFVRGQLVLISNQDNQCGKITPIPSDQIVSSPNVDDFLGYQSGIYARSEIAQLEKQQGIFAEMWCRDISQPNRRDFIVK